MIQAARSLRTTSHRSRQTGIAEGISFFLPYTHAHSHSLHLPAVTHFFSSSLCFLMHTKTHFFVLCCYPPTSPAPLACPGHQSAFPPRFRCDRGAVRASQSEALMLSQSDRATGGNAPNKQPVILPCPFTYSSLSNQSADRVGKSKTPLNMHTAKCTSMYSHIHKYCTHTDVCIIIGSFQRGFHADAH